MSTPSLSKPALVIGIGLAIGGLAGLDLIVVSFAPSGGGHWLLQSSQLMLLAAGVTLAGLGYGLTKEFRLDADRYPAPTFKTKPRPPETDPKPDHDRPQDPPTSADHQALDPSDPAKDPVVSEHSEDSSQLEDPSTSDPPEDPSTSDSLEDLSTSDSSEDPSTSNSLEDLSASGSPKDPGHSESLEDLNMSDSLEDPGSREASEDPELSDDLEVPSTLEDGETPMASEDLEDPDADWIRALSESAPDQPSQPRSESPNLDLEALQTALETERQIRQALEAQLQQESKIKQDLEAELNSFLVLDQQLRIEIAAKQAVEATLAVRDEQLLDLQTRLQATEGRLTQLILERDQLQADLTHQRTQYQTELEHLRSSLQAFTVLEEFDPTSSETEMDPR